jgi:RHS repeat-associated protein
MTEPNGFYYMKARYYDPEVGRFISEDPIGFDGGDVNLMAYVQNNPVNGIDPEGLCGESSGQKKSSYERFMEAFERNRVPGANIFGVPTSLVSLGASAALTGGPTIGEKIAQSLATGAVESQQLTRGGIYLKNFRPGFFTVSGAFRLIGKASWVVTLFYVSADITTAIYTLATFDR